MRRCSCGLRRLRSLFPQEPVTAGSSIVPPGSAEVPAPAYEHLGELPTTYGTQSVYLVAYDPRQLFVYWDVDWAAAGAALYALRVCRADGEVESEVIISSEDAGRYLPAQQPRGHVLRGTGPPRA